mmetsp:Transcript_69748/g.145765  ORF Transcript_69748/g.145765 Transcript_69748/m.145765 type:complete len:200 (+) Transcript_69748:351-950(+)
MQVDKNPWSSISVSAAEAWDGDPSSVGSKLPGSRRPPDAARPRRGLSFAFSSSSSSPSVLIRSSGDIDSDSWASDVYQPVTYEFRSPSGIKPATARRLRVSKAFVRDISLLGSTSGRAASLPALRRMGSGIRRSSRQASIPEGLLFFRSSDCARLPRSVGPPKMGLLCASSESWLPVVELLSKLSERVTLRIGRKKSNE